MNAMIGIGLYTIEEASRYTGIPSRDISRWLFGYLSGRGQKKNQILGLWSSELSKFDVRGLGFHDLLEIRFVHAFRRHGVSLQAIRQASVHARALFAHTHPFTCRRFQTDGRHIFATVLEETEDETLLDLVKKQYVFKQVISPSLYEGIEYGVNGAAGCWYPLHRSKKIVLDPARQFGKPILSQYGVNTAAIYETWLAESQNTSAVARIFEIPNSAVEAAVHFEHKEAA
jgi:hypothetical protein